MEEYRSFMAAYPKTETPKCCEENANGIWQQYICEKPFSVMNFAKNK
jgi:hypothetical protein